MLQKKEGWKLRPKLLDVVELLSDASEPANDPWGGEVAAGALGTIVEELADDFYLVEFGGEGGEPPAILTLPSRSLAVRWTSPA